MGFHQVSFQAIFRPIIDVELLFLVVEVAYFHNNL
jgi:hypothetical protein